MIWQSNGFESSALAQLRWWSKNAQAGPIPLDFPKSYLAIIPLNLLKTFHSSWYVVRPCVEPNFDQKCLTLSAPSILQGNTCWVVRKSSLSCEEIVGEEAGRGVGSNLDRGEEEKRGHITHNSQRQSHIHCKIFGATVISYKYCEPQCILEVSYFVSWKNQCDFLLVPFVVSVLYWEQAMYTILCHFVIIHDQSVVMRKKQATCSRVPILLYPQPSWMLQYIALDSLHYLIGWECSQSTDMNSSYSSVYTKVTPSYHRVINIYIFSNNRTVQYSRL